MKERSNKDLADILRAHVNDLICNNWSSDSAAPVEEAARRLEFGYTPPEAPPIKSPIEEKRDQEKHEAFMAVANRLKSAGLGGHGMFVLDQSTGDAFIFTSHKAMVEHCLTMPGVRTDYRSLTLRDDLGRVFTIVTNGDYGKKTFPAPIEE
jgi:hypothetical protein